MMNVIVVWMTDAETIATVGYNGGRGPVRVYEKNRIDPRATLTEHDAEGRAVDVMPPFFAHHGPAIAHMLAHRGLDGRCQVPVCVGRRLGLTDFAEPATAIAVR